MRFFIDFFLTIIIVYFQLETDPIMRYMHPAVTRHGCY